MTVRIGGLGIEVLISEPAATVGPAGIESEHVEVMSAAPSGDANLFMHAVEVMSVAAVAPVGSEQPRYLGRRRRITTNQTIT